jgi:hypothetical protein
MVPTEQVLKRVADAENVEPSDLEEPLFETIDGDALESLFQSLENGPTRQEGEVRFPYYGYEVVVSAEGDVDVHDRN